MSGRLSNLLLLGTRKASLDQVCQHFEATEIATYRLRALNAATGTSQSQDRPALKTAVLQRQLHHALSHCDFASAVALSGANKKLVKRSLKLNYNLFLLSCLVRIIHERIAAQN